MPGGGAIVPPHHIFMYNHANTQSSMLKKLDFSQSWAWKRAVRFYPIKSSRFGEKDKVRQKYQHFKSGTLTNWVKRLSTIFFLQKWNIILEGSRPPNFKNTFEYSKTFHNMSFLRRIGTLTPPNSKIFRRGWEANRVNQVVDVGGSTLILKIS